MTRLPLPCLMLVTEPSPRLPEIVAEAVAGGVDIVQWRDWETPLTELEAMADEMRLAVFCPHLLVVNSDPDLEEMAKRMGADGIHLPEEGRLCVGGVRKSLKKPMLVGQSIHSWVRAKSAAREGADYVIAGTIFASQSHPDMEPAGLDFLREVCAAVSIPVLAIGGVTPENAGNCLQAGAAGVAVLSPIMRADDPKTVAQAYRTALDAAWKEKQCS